MDRDKIISNLDLLIDKDSLRFRIAKHAHERTLIEQMYEYDVMRWQMEQFEQQESANPRQPDEPLLGKRSV